MILPKYNFYIGKQLDSYFYEKRYIDPFTGITNYNPLIVGNTIPYASTMISVKDFTYIYVDCNSITNETSTAESYVIFYDKNSNRIGSKSLELSDDSSNPKIKIISLPEGTMFIAFNYNSTCKEFMAYQKNNKPFIYGLNICVPHYKELSKKYSKEKNQEFFRESLDGKIVLFNIDYERIKQFNIEDSLIFIIDKLNMELGYLQY